MIASMEKTYLTRPKYVSSSTSPYNRSSVKLIHSNKNYPIIRSVDETFVPLSFSSLVFEQATREEFRSSHHPINSLVPGSLRSRACLGKICRVDILNEVTGIFSSKIRLVLCENAIKCRLFVSKKLITIRSIS